VLMLARAFQAFSPKSLSRIPLLHFHYPINHK
jgi:hypothetical protein